MEMSKKVLEEQNGTVKQKKGWKSIVSSLFIILGFLLGQVLIGLLVNIVFTVKVVAEVGAEVATQEYILERMMNSGIVTVALLGSTILTSLVAVVWYQLGYARQVSKEHFKTLQKSVCNPKAVASLVLTGIACYSLNLCICFIINLVNPASVNQFNELSSVAFSGSAILTFLTTVFVAPIGEEVLLRGILLQRIAKNNKLMVAIIAQAVLFGVYHANIVQGLYVIPMGIVLGYIAYQYKSVLPCIFVHLVNNAMPNLVRLLPEQMLENDTVMGIAFLTIFVCSTAAVIVMNRKNMIQEQ